MAVVFPDVGEQRLLDRMTGKQTNVNAGSLKLFKNNLTPTAATVNGDFTEANFTGYASKTITAATWNAAVGISGKAYATYPNQLWTKSGATGNDIYGWYHQDSTGALLACERFASAPISMNVDGENLSFPLQMKLYDPNS